MADGDVTLLSASADLCTDDGVCVTPDGVATAAEKLKHLSAHPAIAPQSWDIRFSHGLPWGQQSNCEATSVVPGGTVPAMAPATGSMATERAMNAAKMARTMLMALRT